MSSMGVYSKNRSDSKNHLSLTLGMVVYNMLSMGVYLTLGLVVFNILSMDVYGKHRSDSKNYLALTLGMVVFNMLSMLFPWAWWCPKYCVWVYMESTEVIPRII